MSDAVAGAGGRLGEDFLRDLTADWAAHGPAALAKLRDEKPEAYLKIVTGVLPRELHVRVGDLADLSDEQLDERLATLAGALGPDGLGFQFCGAEDRAGESPGREGQAP